jgi:AcrR family transcriptional regulator
MDGFNPQRTRGRYHHGDLRQALIRAADDILRESGVEGFTLRAAARRAGVSPAAPTHHFGNAAGLLTEVAILGYQELGLRLAAAPRDGSPAANLRAHAKAYVEFALGHPGRFKLMFRKELVNRSDPRYLEESSQALTQLANSAAKVYGVTLGPSRTIRDLGAFFAAWSTVHGIAHLALESKFDAALKGHAQNDFIQYVLPEILGVQWPG